MRQPLRGGDVAGLRGSRQRIDKHAFTLYSSEKYNETVAKLEIPLVDDYISKRHKFEMECGNQGMDPQEMRKEFHYTYRIFPAADQH